MRHESSPGNFYYKINNIKSRCLNFQRNPNVCKYMKKGEIIKIYVDLGRVWEYKWRVWKWGCLPVKVCWWKHLYHYTLSLHTTTSLLYCTLPLCCTVARHSITFTFSFTEISWCWHSYNNIIFKFSNVNFIFFMLVKVKHVCCSLILTIRHNKFVYFKGLGNVSFGHILLNESLCLWYSS